MAVGKVSDADFEAEVLKATGPVVVDFWAEWCGPCRMIAPALDEISGTMGDKVKIVKLNVDESPKTASKYGVMSIPTLMICLIATHDNYSRKRPANSRPFALRGHAARAPKHRTLQISAAGGDGGAFRR